MICDPEKHKKHMCVLNEAGKIDLAHSLSTNPTVECGQCGAKAKEPENVCDPVELPDIAWMGDGADTKV